MAAAAFDAWRDNDMNLEPPLACAQTMYVLVSRPISRGKPIGRWEPIVGVSPTSDETALTPQSLFGMACCRNAAPGRTCVSTVAVVQVLGFVSATVLEGKKVHT